MTTTTYLVGGASRGLGLETVRQILALSPSNRIIATVRNLTSATELAELSKGNPGRIEIATMDVADSASVQKGFEEISKLEFAKDGIDVLFANAGIMGTGGWKSVLNSTVDDLHDSLNTNLFGAVQLTLGALPLLRQGSGQKKIFVTSSLVGSIGGPISQGTAAGMYAVSKAAVNMYFVKLARELAPEKFTVLVFHPGYVKTALTGGKDGPADIFEDEAVEKYLSVLLPKTHTDSGKFYNYTGEEIVW